MTTVECPGCGLVHEARGRPRPAKRGATGECFEEYGILLDRSYSRAEYRPAHQLVVDAYICQHPGTSRREVQSTALCLMTLCLFCADAADPADPADPADGPWLHAMMMRGRPDFFHHLDPPDLTGLLTHREVLMARSASEHALLARAWAGSVWSAWEPQHAVVGEWVARACGDVVGRGGRRPRR